VNKGLHDDDDDDDDDDDGEREREREKACGKGFYEIKNRYK
jgi:hypothetical protein